MVSEIALKNNTFFMEDHGFVRVIIKPLKLLDLVKKSVVNN